MRVLVVRRDNVGDLVCTTPLLRALRRGFPQAWLGALVNSYNAPVLEGNSDLDAVMAYTKLKHLGAGEGALSALGNGLAMLWRLRRMHLDTVVLATPDFVPRLARLARWLAPRQVIGFSDGSPGALRMLDWSIPVARVQGLHEVERVFSLAAYFDLHGAPPPLRLAADPAQVQKAARAFGTATGPRVAIHITARRPRQRWPAERFAQLIAQLHAQHGAAAMLLWYPGARDDPRHPGDDDKAREVQQWLAGKVALAAYRTQTLPELIGALAACDVVVTPDGGALHLAAGLGKPTVALFGDSSPERWGPWGVPHRVLRPPSQNVSDLSVAKVGDAFTDLLREAVHV